MDRNLLLLVDGSNLLFQMFYGMPARIAGKDGRPIQGTLGFVGALLKIIRRVSPTHILVLFDGQGVNDRSKLLDDYKSNRVDYSTVDDEDNPYTQLGDICRALDCMGICHSECTGYEADDALASLSHEHRRDFDIVISSFDSDLFQLIDEDVKILRYRGEKSVLCDLDWLKDKYGITPGQYVFFKALTGDTADNIKGVPGVGPKTAAQLVNTFADAEDMLSHSDQITKPSVRKAVCQHSDRVQRNLQLIRLREDVPLPFEIEKLQYTDRGYTTMEVLRLCDLR